MVPTYSLIVMVAVVSIGAQQSTSATIDEVLERVSCSARAGWLGSSFNGFGLQTSGFGQKCSQTLGRAEYRNFRRFQTSAQETLVVP